LKKHVGPQLSFWITHLFRFYHRSSLLLLLTISSGIHTNGLMTLMRDKFVAEWSRIQRRGPTSRLPALRKWSQA